MSLVGLAFLRLKVERPQAVALWALLLGVKLVAADVDVDSTGVLLPYSARASWKGAPQSLAWNVVGSSRCQMQAMRSLFRADALQTLS